MFVFRTLFLGTSSPTLSLSRKLRSESSRNFFCIMIFFRLFSLKYIDKICVSRKNFSHYLETDSKLKKRFDNANIHWTKTYIYCKRYFVCFLKLNLPPNKAGITLIQTLLVFLSRNWNRIDAITHVRPMSNV